MVCLLSSGCATGSQRGRNLVRQPDDGARWESNRRRRPLTKRTLETKKVPVEQVADRFANAEECEVAARRVYANNPGGAWALMRACIQRRGFIDLRRLLDPPWDQILERRWQESLDVILEVIARRGGNLPLDVEMVRHKGLPLYRLAVVRADPDDYHGRFVMLRGTIATAQAKGSGLVLEIDTEDGLVLGRLSSADSKLRTDVEYVFLARFEKIAVRARSVLDTPPLVVKLLGYHRPLRATVF